MNDTIIIDDMSTAKVIINGLIDRINNLESAHRKVKERIEEMRDEHDYEEHIYSDYAWKSAKLNPPTKDGAYLCAINRFSDKCRYSCVLIYRDNTEAWYWGDSSDSSVDTDDFEITEWTEMLAPIRYKDYKII